MVAGRGRIVVGLTIFALWNPLRGFFGAFLFEGYSCSVPAPATSDTLEPARHCCRISRRLFVLFLDGLHKDHRNLHAPRSSARPTSAERFERGPRRFFVLVDVQRVPGIADPLVLGDFLPRCTAARPREVAAFFLEFVVEGP
jgi:hypothetical protein